MSHASPSSGSPAGWLNRLVRAVKKLNIYALWRRVEAHESLDALAREHGLRLAAAETRLDAIENAVRAVQLELAETRDQRLAGVEQRMDDAETLMDGINRRYDLSESSLRGMQTEIVRLRDELVPAVSARGDALVGRLMAELDEVASLVERMLAGEPLPLPLSDPGIERDLAAALDRVQPALVAAFRGSEEEITHRMDRYLDELKASPPVLDLGCGRGELLLLLREAGVPARGVEGDPNLAQAARRRGLDVLEGDVVNTLAALPEGSVGAVTAFHLFEHLPPAQLAAALRQVRRVLRPGGLLLVEGPNPGSLQVAGSLHWLDPTHQHPLHAETLRVFVAAAGLEPQSVELLHPFETEQLLISAIADSELAPGGAGDPRVDRLARRLDELIHGHRDFALRANRPHDRASR